MLSILADAGKIESICRRHRCGIPMEPDYKKMYDKKPFRDAILFYYDNGLYKIISPGEEHYGSYVVEGDFSDRKYTVHYIAFPSVDWNNTSAYHVLEFDNATSRFTQRAIVPVDGKIPQQHGDFSVGENKLVNPIGVNWENGKDLLPSPSAASRSADSLSAY